VGIHAGFGLDKVIHARCQGFATKGEVIPITVQLPEIRSRGYTLEFQGGGTPLRCDAGQVFDGFGITYSAVGPAVMKAMLAISLISQVSRFRPLRRELGKMWCHWMK